MSARGVLIKPWLFREATEGYLDLTGEDRVAIYRRYVALAKEHWGGDAFGLERVTQFTRWHTDFWYRYVRQRPDGTFPGLQTREQDLNLRTPLEAFLARPDDAAHDYLTACLVHDREIDPEQCPAPADSRERELVETEG
jgi:tRNA-dihydrouridine synthase